MGNGAPVSALERDGTILVTVSAMVAVPPSNIELTSMARYANDGNWHVTGRHFDGVRAVPDRYADDAERRLTFCSSADRVLRLVRRRNHPCRARARGYPRREIGVHWLNG
jgi:hypothetical protein